MTERPGYDPEHIVRGLSLPRRGGHLVAGLGGLTTVAVVGLLWATEPGGWEGFQAVMASRTLAVSTNCSKRTMRPPRTMKWWATRTLMSLPVALLVAV